jgi:anti-anti-sigma factor
VAGYEVLERTGDYVVLRLEGELIGDPPVERLHESLEKHYVDDGVVLICVDLRDVDFISLEGVGMLLSLWRESQRRGKRFRIDQPTPLVRHRLEQTGVLKVLEGGQ